MVAYEATGFVTTHVSLIGFGGGAHKTGIEVARLFPSYYGG